MIKINLLPQRKPKRASEPGQRQVFLGIGALAAAAAVTEKIELTNSVMLGPLPTNAVQTPPSRR
jgi:hypothetical protein